MPMNRRIAMSNGLAALAIVLSGRAVFAEMPAATDTIRIGYQKSSTLTAILKTNGELEKALVPLGIRVTLA